MLDRSLWRNFDYWLMLAVLALCGIGIAMVYSATLNVPSYESYPARQLVYVLIGLVLLMGAAAFDYRLLTAMQWPLLILMLYPVALRVVALITGGA